MKKRKGYTLVELVVVLVILTILVSAAAFGLYSYTRYAKFKNYNENAQSVYTAAQQALTHYKASGQLDDFAKEVQLYALKTATDTNFQRISNPKISAKFNQRLYTIFYCQNSSRTTRGYDDNSRALFEELMDRYLGDQDLMNGNIAIEFDPNDGVVYSISYSLQADELYYGVNNSDDKDESSVDITDRSESVRKERMFGYYDVNDLTAAAPSKGTKPTITDLELVNNEELYLRWRLDDIYSDVAKFFKYKINLYDGSKDYDSNLEPLMTLEVNNDNSLIPSSESQASDKEIACEVTRGSEKKTVPLRSYFKDENGSTYFYLILDAIDLGDFESNGNDKLKLKDNLDDTYSINRFNLTADSIYARISASGDSYRSSAWKQSNKADIMFDSRSNKTIVQDITGGTYEQVIANISNNRHLFNIRFIEDKYNNDISIDKRYIYYQKASFNYDHALIYKTNSKYLTDKILLERNVDEYSGDDLPSFPAIKKLNQNSSYVSEGSTIKNLTLGAKDQDETGLFIINGGNIDGIDLDSVIAVGRDNVAAIACYNANTIKNAKVSGDVTGEKYVGGISSQLINEGTPVKVPFSGNENNATITGGENVGGIIGFAQALYGNNQGERIVYTIENCINTGRILENSDLNSSYSNLGGIAGRNDGCIIDSCTSAPNWQIDEALNLKLEADNVGGIVGYNDGQVKDCTTGRANQATFVVGDEYVGGIVGKQGFYGQIINSSSTNKSNQCNIVGNNYVGGIAGKNENAGTIEGWSNEGAIICRGQYGGGIVGDNAGDLLDCRSYVRRNSLTIDYKIVIEENKNASNLGGIAGINSGVIRQSSNKVQGNISFVVGKNNLGGIVGYNTGAIYHQELTGGYIIGTGNNVGGYIGYNESIDAIKLEMSGTVTVSLNEVSGNNNVGGIIGNNRIDYPDEFTASFNTNSFSGNVKGNQAVGGYIGLNHATGTGMMVITSSDKQNSMNQIEGNIYVGGIIGRNDDDGNSHKVIMIKNINNQTRVVSKGIKTIAGINYSYTGGIIGENGSNMIIDNCSNQRAIVVNEQATYLGGLVEVNQGIIRNCKVYSLGNYSRSNVGGIAGINQDKASIEACEIKDGTITGKNNVGGFVADNYGMIINIYNSSGKVVAGGDNVGGLAANNYGYISNTSTSIDINASGNNVGGIVGKNQGSLDEIIIASANNVKGSKNVGGIIGYQSSGDLNGLTNLNDVTATNNNAGGIIGNISNSNSVISNCSNSGKVVCSGTNGYAGGIIPNISKNIIVTECINTGDVQSTYYYAGGIAAKNNGIISRSTVTNKAEIKGKSYTGGITTYNYGMIEDSEVGDIILTVNGFIVGDKIEIGGICAYNDTDATIKNTGSIANTTLSINSIYINSYLGGVAGKNDGTIIADNSNTVIRANINNNILAQFDTNIGGITAVNDGMIKNYTYSGTINGNGGSTFGYGGIAGINNQFIEGCQSIDITINTKGDSANPANTGGIAGINNGSITTSTIGGTSTLTTPIGFAYMGGIAGLNIGDISNCIHQSDKGVLVAGNVTISINSGCAGGIVGFNRGSGSVNNVSTSKNWTNGIICAKGSTDTAVGGIIGYSNSKAINYINLNNYTNVKKNISDSAGGIIGRLENNSTRWKLQNCNNYGNISAASGRSGGIIGQLKYRGGDLLDCTNYGDISTNSGTAGVIGFLYSISDNEQLVVSNCANFGDISGSNSAGIIGYQNEVSNKAKIYINNCINVGSVTANNSAGIVTINSGKGKYYLNNNVNYYYFEYTEHWWETNKTPSSAGIVKVNNKNNLSDIAELKNNIDVGNSTYPCSNSSNNINKNNFYFSDKDSSKKGTSSLKTSYKNGIWNASNGDFGISIVGMPIDPTEDYSAMYKYENLNANISGYLNGDDKDYSNVEKPVIQENVEDLGGTYRVSWSFGENSSQYELSVIADGVETKQIVYGNKFGNIAIPSSWYNKIIDVKVRAKASSEERSSPWSDVKSIKIKEPLKTPSVHFVLKDKDTNKLYLTVDNIDDYQVGDKITVGGAGTLSYLNGNSYTNIGASGTFEVILNNDGKKELVYINNNTEYNVICINTVTAAKVVTAQAKPGNLSYEKGNSIVYSGQAKLYSLSDMANNQISLNGFKGTSSDSLRYEIGFISRTSEIQVFFRQDLLLNDEAVSGLEVVESSSTYRINKDGTNMKTELSAIPEKIGNYAGKQVHVQSYMWMSQNDIARYYYYLDGLKEVNSETINSNLDTFSEIVNGQRQMKKGYVIERVDDDLYNVFYSSALASNYTGTNPSSNRYVSTYVNVPEKVSAVTIDQPKIVDNYYTMSWRDENPENNPNYKLIVYGSMAKDVNGDPINEIELVNEEINGNSLPDHISKNGNEYEYRELENSDQWNYKYLRVVISHYGTDNNNGYTNKLSNTVSEIFEYKLRLSQITAPQVSIADGYNDYTYNIVWDNYVDEVGASDEDKQINAIDHFEVIAKSKTADGKTYLKKVSYPITDENRNSKQFNSSIELDFDVNNPINDNEIIEFYVNAIAKKDNPNYTDSIDGDKTSLSLPHRLKQPFSNLDDQLIVPAGPIDVETINNDGVEITMTSNSDEVNSYDSANYQLIYSYDGINYLDQERALSLSGNISEGTINLNDIISGNRDLIDYVGKTIYVKLRLVAPNAISSPWSDEQIIAIPKAKLVLEPADIVITSKQHIINNDAGELYDDALNQKVISLPYLEYSNGYSFDITYNQAIDKAYQYYHELSYLDPNTNELAYYDYYQDNLRIIDNGIVDENNQLIENRFSIIYKEYFVKVDEFNYPVDQNGIRLTGNDIKDKLIIESIERQIDIPAVSVVNNVYTCPLTPLAKVYTKEVGDALISVTLVPSIYINVDQSGNVLSYQYELLDTLSKLDANIGIDSTKAITTQVLINAIGINENYVDSQTIRFYRYNVESTYQDGLEIYGASPQTKLLVMENLVDYEICYYIKNEYLEEIA